MEIGILENYLKIKVLKIGILENYWKIEALKIKFKNENFEKLCENRIFIKIIFLTLKDEELRGPNTWPSGVIHLGVAMHLVTTTKSCASHQGWKQAVHAQPVVELIMRTTQPACEVPVTMFLMKSQWPGASITVQ